MSGEAGNANSQEESTPQSHTAPAPRTPVAITAETIREDLKDHKENIHGSKETTVNKA